MYDEEVGTLGTYKMELVEYLPQSSSSSRGRYLVYRRDEVPLSSIPTFLCSAKRSGGCWYNGACCHCGR